MKKQPESVQAADSRHGCVLVVGSANMDLVVTCDRFPSPGETLFAEGFAMYPGGKGANQAVACARLGAEVVFLGKMGDDIFGDHLMRSLGENGVLVDHLMIDAQEPTGIAVITVDLHGQNHIVVSSGSNMALSPDEIEQKADLFSGADVVLLQLEIPLATVERSAQLAKESGAAVILNPAPAASLPDSLLRCVDYLTPNVGELEILMGRKVAGPDAAADAAAGLIARGVETVVVTMGEQGALCVTAGDSRMYRGKSVSAIDTTAAGDAFSGALAFAIANGFRLDRAIHLANAVAAFSVTRHGAQPSMPTIGDLEALGVPVDTVAGGAHST